MSRFTETPQQLLDEIKRLRAENLHCEHQMEISRAAVFEETKERCAKMVEDCFDIEIARAIRALKDKQENS